MVHRSSLSLLTHFLCRNRVCKLTKPLFSFLLTSLSARTLSLATHLVIQSFRSCNMLEITCILLRTLFFPCFFFFFYLSSSALPRSCAPGFAICPCFIASYLSTLYVSYIGCLVRNKATLVMHLSLLSVLLLLCVYVLDKRKNCEISPRGVDTLDRSEGLDIFG
jgi:hypothetical protein